MRKCEVCVRRSRGREGEERQTCWEERRAGWRRRGRGGGGGGGGTADHCSKGIPRLERGVAPRFHPPSPPYPPPSISVFTRAES